MSSQELPGKNNSAFEFSEEQDTMRICSYLTQSYGHVKYFCDGSGLLLTKKQAAKFARMKSCRGIPDLIVLHPNDKYHGLCIEMKKVGTTIFLKDGSLTTDKHIREQADVLESLEKVGYYTCFAIGYDEAKKVVDSYMANEL